MKKTYLFLVLLLLFAAGCKRENNNTTTEPVTKNLTIFFINDQHGQIDNFSKIKQIIDREKQQTNANVIVACAGDIFSGNPIVDNYPEKGYPMIDVMNRVGFNISELGNHDFDYGEQILKKRMLQAHFHWICANVNMENSGIPQPAPYLTLQSGNLKITFLGLIETNGKPDAVIPSTDPNKIKDIRFERPENVVAKYADIKKKENSDLYIALTHLGFSQKKYSDLGDEQLALQYPYFDLIIGGHSHQYIDTVINHIPIFQVGSYLHSLGKISLAVKNKKIISLKYDCINLDKYQGEDAGLMKIIDTYDNSMPQLNDVIGYAHQKMYKSQTGCFYTDALRAAMKVDVSFQNTGGIRADLNKGDITKRDIYRISPFNNGTVIYHMTVGQIKNFLMGSRSGFYYSGMGINQKGSEVQISDTSGNILKDNKILTVGLNDYIPAVYDNYFPSDGKIQPLTAAETLIYYLEHIDSEVDYPHCDRYFRYR